MDGLGIARALAVSLNTPRTHTTNIYPKLGVDTRMRRYLVASIATLSSRAGVMPGAPSSDVMSPQPRVNRERPAEQRFGVGAEGRGGESLRRRKVIGRE